MHSSTTKADLYADVRVHTATATSKYLHENVALAGRVPMTSLEAQGDTDPAVYAGIMTLLERALAHVPRAVLLSKGPRIASALVGVANRHAEHAPVLRGEPSPYSVDDLIARARLCTQREDDANRVERQVRKAAAAMLVADRIGQRFPAVVTGASPKGTYVRTLVPHIEGRLVTGEAGLDVGDRVTVRLSSVNVDRGFIDFAVA